ncbi:MAG TPA: heme ABC exporter ATP-binding protein CcmA [Gemmatimonadales bacterium]|nr:heme ABC exporter ATP-binding protein CcmA [Gemmatimonadales bacterium]
MQPDAPVLEVRGLTRRYGRARVLKGVDLAVQPGEVVALLGPNGAGKTTLLRVLAGLARAEDGVVLVRGRHPAADPLAARRAIGLVEHRSLLYGELTPRENLAFTARLFGLDGAAVAAAVERLDIGKHADLPVASLSRGMVQRTSVARALLHSPSILLLDEPFSGLDAPSAARLVSLLGARRAEGVAVLLVTHQPEEAWSLITRVAVLHGGRVVVDRPRPSTPAETSRLYHEAIGG